MDDITKVLLAITTVAMVSVIVVNGVNSAKVAGAVTGGFSNALSTAERG